MELAQSVASGVITSEAGKAIATAAFPLLSSETIDRIFDNIEAGEITPEQVRSNHATSDLQQPLFREIRAHRLQADSRWH
jgi:hypothetical protein